MANVPPPGPPPMSAPNTNIMPNHTRPPPGMMPPHMMGGGPPPPPHMMGGPPPGMMPPHMMGGPPPPHMMGMMAGGPPMPPPAVAVKKAPLVFNDDPDQPPNNTIYISNLNEKVKEANLKKELEAIFKDYGKILQIVAMKSLTRRGQAFVVFENLDDAIKARKEMNGFEYHKKNMRIRFATTKSDIIAKREGTYEERPKKPLPPKPSSKRPANDDSGSSDEDDEDEHNAKRVAPSAGAALPASAAVLPPVVIETPPNKILFITELPDDTTQNMLQVLFAQHQGFKEVRMIPSRPDIAFVEYDNEFQSGVAKQFLQGYKISEGGNLKIDFAKK